MTGAQERVRSCTVRNFTPWKPKENPVTSFLTIKHPYLTINCLSWNSLHLDSFWKKTRGYDFLGVLTGKISVLSQISKSTEETGKYCKNSEIIKGREIIAMFL